MKIADDISWHIPEPKKPGGKEYWTVYTFGDRQKAFVRANTNGFGNGAKHTIPIYSEAFPYPDEQHIVREHPRQRQLSRYEISFRTGSDVEYCISLMKQAYLKVRGAVSDMRTIERVAKPLSIISKRSDELSHGEIKTLIRQVGEILADISRVGVRYCEEEYKINGMRLDVAWKAVPEGNPKFAFEVQVSGNLFEALGKVKHAYDVWSSRPVVITDEKGIEQAKSLLKGMYHEIESEASVISWRRVQKLQNHLVEAKRLLSEMKFISRSK